MQIPTISTEGIKYAGSKLKIIPYILEIISQLDDVENVLDGFSGTTRVSQVFGKIGYNTTANDIMGGSRKIMVVKKPS
ncbi:MAG: Site-specific DNA-methyltransferase (adenine-specific) [Bacteroidetes bacterium]|nr:Site-specific DNA-methyltransferase (adenine-specific) [Bacteroidota bacterium]